MAVPVTVEKGAPLDAQKKARGPEIHPELTAVLSDLSPEESALVARLVRKAKTGPEGQRVPLDDVSIVHEFLKVDLENDDFSVLQNITAYTAKPTVKHYPERPQIELPQDLLPIDFSLGEVISKRASRRDFSKGPMSLQELASLLHYSYGVRSRMLAYNVKGFSNRYVPTMGGLQSPEIYFTANAVEGLEQGLYHYNPDRHTVELLDQGNLRRKVVRACIKQDWLDAASIVLFLTSCMDKVYWKYGRRAYRFVHADLGILAQTLHLVSNALRLRSCMVAGYVDDEIHDLLQIDGREEFVGLLLGVGRKSFEPRPPERNGNSAGTPTE